MKPDSKGFTILFFGLPIDAFIYHANLLHITRTRRGRRTMTIAKMRVRLEDMKCFQRRMKRIREIDPEYAEDMAEVLKEFGTSLTREAFVMAMFSDFVKMSR